MATVQITVPDAIVPRLKTAMRGIFTQHEDLGDVAAFRQVTADYWREILASYEAQEAAKTAVEAAQSKAVADAAGIV